MRAVIRIHRCLCRDEGSAIVETALASMIFLSMLLGAFQGMLALYTSDYVSDVARQASRYAIVRGSTSCTNTPSLSNCNATAAQIQSHVKSNAYPGIKTSKLTITTSWLTASGTVPATWSACTSGTCNAPGNMVRVKATYAFPLSIPFVPKSTFNFTSTSNMVISQ
jgi:Flp pilus assembly protein TadG